MSASASLPIMSLNPNQQQPPSGSGAQVQAAASGPALRRRFVVECFESQRFLPGFGWHRPLLPGDWPKWGTNRQGEWGVWAGDKQKADRRTMDRLTIMELPLGSGWAGPWEVDMNGADSEGWRYGELEHRVPDSACGVFR